MRRLVDGDTASSVLAKFLGLLDGLDAEVKAVYLDREFYDSKCLTLLHAHNYAYAMLTVQWDKQLSRNSRKNGSASSNMS